MSMLLDVIIPIAPYEYLDDRVLQSIDISHQLWIHTSESPAENLVWISRIVNARNQLRHQTTSEFVLCMDSDVILPPSILAQGIDTIKESKTIGMLGIPTHLGANTNPMGHVKIKCALVHGDLLRKVPFRYTHNYCECVCFARDIRFQGYRTQYMDTDKYCEVIDNAKNSTTRSRTSH